MRKWWIFSGAAAALLVACLDFDALSGGNTDAGVVTTDAGDDSNACASSQKMCVGRCVDQSDPSVGCSGECSACAATPNAQAVCVLQNDSEVCGTGTCNPQFGNCDNQPENGCETQVTTATNCGACGTSCAPLPYCEPSASATGGYICSSSCDLPNSICGAQCVDTATDNGNCGGCGAKCSVANGIGICTSGKCTISCNSKYFSCGGGCVVPSDSQCGSACKPCGAGTTCETEVSSPSYGTCTSNGSGGSKCDAGTDFTQDPNCGACGVDCASSGLKCCGGSVFLDGGKTPNMCKSAGALGCIGD